MAKRYSNRRRKRNRVSSTRNKQQFLLICAFAFILLVIIGVIHSFVPLTQSWFSNSSKQIESNQTDNQVEMVKTARIMAHGDLLYHDLLYMSALQPDGSYDFSENFTYVKPWIEQADLAIADYEGTISPDFPLAGYPLFNAPEVVAKNISEAGYDVVDLAHNHILDSRLSGLISTVAAFKNVNVDSVGVYEEGNRSTAPIYIREVNGIKIAILAYAYGFNGMEGLLTQEEYDSYLSDFNRQKMQEEIEKAEKEADFTIVMPQTGVEYQLEPTEEQVTLYHQMVDWGADLVLGGHPHVAEPSETIEKDGEKKLIIYSMGNFISNQRIETMGDTPNSQWTERGVLMDVTLEKKGGITRIQTAKAHPTWVSKVSKGTYSPLGNELFTYQTLILEDFVQGGKHYGSLDEVTQARIETAYQEMNVFMNLNW
ncbi:TPA: CapA family protein [Streptococcus suis]|nr:CapA family protein [Streptococcus suis]HEM2547652.1 CapA family protein [Streptococcus suis]